VLWLIVFCALAVAGLVTVLCYGIWLAHKLSDLLAELRMLAQTGERLAELASEITFPQRGWTAQADVDLIEG
jgi:hypothetical protein